MDTTPNRPLLANPKSRCYHHLGWEDHGPSAALQGNPLPRRLRCLSSGDETSRCPVRRVADPAPTRPPKAPFTIPAAPTRRARQNSPPPPDTSLKTPEHKPNSQYKQHRPRTPSPSSENPHRPDNSAPGHHLPTPKSASPHRIPLFLHVKGTPLKRVTSETQGHPQAGAAPPISTPSVSPPPNWQRHHRRYANKSDPRPSPVGPQP